MFKLNSIHIPIEYRYLGLLMGLPLIDGVFLSIILSGGLNTFTDAILIGSFVLGGGATISVILSKFDNNKYITMRRVLIVGLFVSIIATIQGLMATTIEPYINITRFKYGAMIALVSLAYEIMPKSKNYKLFKPTIIILITMIFSLQLNQPLNLDISIDYVTGQYALISSLTATTISIITVYYRNIITRFVDTHILQYVTSLGLIMIVFSMGGLIPNTVSLIIFMFGFSLSIFISDEQIKELFKTKKLT